MNIPLEQRIADSIRAGFRLAWPGQSIPVVDFDVGVPQQLLAGLESRSLQSGAKGAE